MAATRNAWNVEVNALSAAAYLNECIAQFIARNEHAQDADVVRYRTNKGNPRIKLTVRCDDTNGRVNVPINSTFSLDWERVDASFKKHHDALRAKEQERKAAGPCVKRERANHGPTKAELAAQVAQLQAQLATLLAAAQQ